MIGSDVVSLVLGSRKKTEHRQISPGSYAGTNVEKLCSFPSLKLLKFCFLRPRPVPLYLLQREFLKIQDENNEVHLWPYVKVQTEEMKLEFTVKKRKKETVAAYL